MRKLQFVEGEVVPQGGQRVRVVIGCAWMVFGFRQGWSAISGKRVVKECGGARRTCELRGWGEFRIEGDDDR